MRRITDARAFGRRGIVVAGCARWRPRRRRRRRLASTAKPWAMPRTADGKPDLQGIWTTPR